MSAGSISSWSQGLRAHNESSRLRRSLAILLVPGWWVFWLLMAWWVQGDLIPIRPFTYFYILSAAGLFLIGTLLAVQLYPRSVGGPALEADSRRVEKIVKRTVIVATLVNSFFAIRTVQKYSLYGAYIRQAIFEYNSDFFYSTWIHVIYQCTFYPLTIVAIIYCAEFTVRKRSAQWLLTAVVVATASDLVYFSRFSIYTLLLALIVAAFGAPWATGVRRSMAKTRAMVVMIVASVLLVVAAVLVTNARDGSLTTERGGYLDEAVSYHTVGYHLFDRQLYGDSLQEFSGGWGRCTFGAFDLFAGLLIRRFDDNYEPFSRGADYARQKPVDLSAESGQPRTFNAFYTGFSSFLLDFGIIGSLVECLVMGVLYGLAYRRALKRRTVGSISIFIFLTAMFLRFIFNSPVEAPYFWIGLLFLYWMDRYVPARKDNPARVDRPSITMSAQRG